MQAVKRYKLSDDEKTVRDRMQRESCERMWNAADDALRAQLLKADWFIRP